MCSEFVTQQKNVLLTTQPNLNDKKTRQVTKINKLSKSLKNKQDSLLSNTGGMSAVGAETTPTRGKAAISINCQILLHPEWMLLILPLVA